jgi:hypothetical protein
MNISLRGFLFNMENLGFVYLFSTLQSHQEELGRGSVDQQIG